MKKPTAKKIERLDYPECADYIEKKLGYNLRDTLGKFSTENTKSGAYEKIEYRDFWHFIVDVCNVHNGCEFYMPDPKDEWYFKDNKREWIKPILEAFWEEFGAGPYWVEW